jgi:8-oxo-dGTP pyrophosphatase MutT (NUDIX family)
VTEEHRFPVDVLVIIVRDGHILLTERAGAVYLAGRWSVPGGKVASGETVLAAAVREVAEEVGLTLDPCRLAFVGVTHHRPPHGDSRIGFGFAARVDATARPRNLEPPKCARLGWFDPRALPHPTMPYTAEIVRLYLGCTPFSLHGWTGATRP